ncbi:hypothetical protein GJAV_G00106690 [Gymnothorax javanicus]|nr:hypothetical protein GJAV_G00106690 [Gymnothorax javanicus]
MTASVVLRTRWIDPVMFLYENDTDDVTSDMNAFPGGKFAANQCRNSASHPVSLSLNVPYTSYDPPAPGSGESGKQCSAARTTSSVSLPYAYFGNGYYPCRIPHENGVKAGAQSLPAYGEKYIDTSGPGEDFPYRAKELALYQGYTAGAYQPVPSYLELPRGVSGWSNQVYCKREQSQPGSLWKARLPDTAPHAGVEGCSLHRVRKKRVPYTKVQLKELEREYAASRFITRDKRRRISAQTSLSERQVTIWFQNRRVKEKKVNGWRWISTSAPASQNFCSRSRSCFKEGTSGRRPENHVTRRHSRKTPASRAVMDFDERVSSVGANMYLPSCTYYVSGTDFPGLPSFLTQNPSSCPVTYSYPSSLPQVQPVRELTFRDYTIDSSSKWHHRGELPHCYPAENRVHRDCLPPPATGEMFAKNSPSAGYHTGSNAAPSFYSSVGRNGVLPQVFDQFFDSAYGNTENMSGVGSGGKNGDKQATPVPGPCREIEVKDRGDGNSSPEASSGNNEDKPSSGSGQRTRKKRCPYSKYQIRELEREFFFSVYINKEKRMQLSRMLNLTDRQGVCPDRVEHWTSEVNFKFEDADGKADGDIKRNPKTY